MGAIFRVQTHYTDLPEYLKKLDPQIPVYGAFLDGENIYAKDLSPHGVLVMGNEGNGISEEVERLVTCKISIPRSLQEKGQSRSM
jgi:TrmH family RNA methyltransferase